MKPLFSTTPLVGACSGFAACLGLLLGSLVSTSACTVCECPQLDPLPLGAVEVTASDARPELIGGIVDIQSESITISYATTDGDWVVSYPVEYRTPEDD